MDHRERAKHYVQEPWQTGRMQLLFVSSAVNLCKSTFPRVLQVLIADTSVKEREWCENYSRWLVPRRPASSSLTKLMLLVEQDLMMAQEATMKSNVPCLNSLPNWTFSILEGTLKSFLLQIGQVL